MMLNKTNHKKLQRWIKVQVKAFEERRLVLNNDFELRNISYSDGIHISGDTLKLILEEFDYGVCVVDRYKNTKTQYPNTETQYLYEVRVKVSPYSFMFDLCTEDEFAEIKDILNYRG